jgi:L-ascorbate metabolism protein UlaG (beta-lactamase superfamily)
MEAVPMTSGLKYLGQDVAFEPLVCRWYAWPLLVSPSTLALIAKNRLIPLLESFLEDPDFHRSSSKDPTLRGGSFVNYAGDVGLAEAVLDRMLDQLDPHLAFADALLVANDLLQRDGDGSSLEPLYARMPKALRGLVELGYDLNNHASLRLIEPLLYASPLYDPSLQSVLLRRIGEEERPFILTTPLIDPSAGLLLEAPFESSLYDELARSRDHGLAPAAFDRLCNRMAEHGADPARVAGFFADAPAPRRHAPPPEGSVRVRYFGHASLLIESGGTSIMTDPSIGHDTGTGIPRFSFADLPESIDYVLLTHNHQDHVLLETLLQLRHRIGTIVVPRSNGGTPQDPSLRLALQKAGFTRIVELDEMESIPLPGGSIIGLPFLGEHCDLHIRSKLAFQVEMAGRTVLCLADSNNLEPALYERLSRLLAPPDLIFIGMECAGGPMSWLYGDLLPRRLKREHDQSRRLNGSDFERARAIVDLLRPRGVLVYAMGAEPWFTHITSLVYSEQSAPIVESNRLVAHCRDRGITAERMYGKREILLDAKAVTLQ